MLAPHGLDEICRVYGDPRRHLRADGTLAPTWEQTYIVRVPLPAPLKYGDGQVTRVTSHKLAVEPLVAALLRVYREGLWFKLREYGGGFEPRAQRGSAKMSLHTWGVAWDFDPSNNALGTVGTMDSEIVAAFKAEGFTWGGEFSGRKDPMHFQLASGY